MMSGGTNINSTELAKKCDVHPHCIAIGSYARKIVKKHLAMKDLFENKTAFKEAVNIAQNLVETSLKNMEND